MNIKKIVRYNGFKEELYLKDFIPDPNFRTIINVSNYQILVIIRPPSTVSNYHDSRSEHLLIESIKFFSKHQNTVVLIVNRNEYERKLIEKNIALEPNIRFLEKTVDGLQLLYSADISFSGGGTMNRESALLGTKTYSIFTGKRTYLDEYLQDLGKLKFIKESSELYDIDIKKSKKEIPKYNNNLALEITDLIIDNYKKYCN